MKSSMLVTALGSLFLSVSVFARSPILPSSNTYEGSMDCASAKAFVSSPHRFYLSDYDCKVVVTTTMERQNQFGDRFGSFTYEVTTLSHRAPASWNFSDSGTYKTSHNGRIFLNFGGHDYPRPRVNYPYGDFTRRGLVLATSVRGGTLLVRN